jgi:hypothetical protein
MRAPLRCLALETISGSGADIASLPPFLLPAQLSGPFTDLQRNDPQHFSDHRIVMLRPAT